VTARVVVRRIIDGVSGQLGAPHVFGDGLESLDPQIPLTFYVKAAFAAGANAVNIRGPAAAARFGLVADYVDFVKLDNQSPQAARYQVYEFREWIT
jgi:hypothetical protein